MKLETLDFMAVFKVAKLLEVFKTLFDFKFSMLLWTISIFVNKLKPDIMNLSAFSNLGDSLAKHSLIIFSLSFLS